MREFEMFYEQNDESQDRVTEARKYLPSYVKECDEFSSYKSRKLLEGYNRGDASFTDLKVHMPIYIWLVLLRCNWQNLCMYF